MTTKNMKNSTSKVVIAIINKKKFQINVDSDIFDDIFVEAATRAVESQKNNPSFFHKIISIGECYEKGNEHSYEKHYQINMYHVLNNAGMYAIAELVREKIKNLHKIDLQFEPTRSNVGKH